MSVTDLTVSQEQGPGDGAEMEFRTPDADAERGAFALVDPKALERRRRVRLRVPRLTVRIVGPLLALGLWQLLCTVGVFDSSTIPSPVSVVRAGQQLWTSGELQSSFAISLERVAIGLGIGTVAGVVLALISGFFRMGEDLLDPLIQIVRSVPILGLIPLVIIWFGVGEVSKVFLIALGCTFPIYINTHAAIRGVDAKFAEMGSTFGLSRLGMAGRVVFPGAIPGFLVGLRFALVGCWLIIVVAEEINAQSGLGYLLAQAQSSYRTDIMVLVLAIYGILGLVADMLVRLLERSLLGWRRGFTAS
ncbi:MAG TPA: ABC transporter permease subunit [Acidimicrobiales bacterium]